MASTGKARAPSGHVRRTVEANRSDALRLAAETGLDPRTCSRWLLGEPMHHALASLIKAAAVKLKIVPSTSLSGVDRGDPVPSRKRGA